MNKITMIETKEFDIHTLSKQEIKALAWFRLLEKQDQSLIIGHMQGMVERKISDKINSITILLNS